jgi:hypothetical protein
MCKEALEMSTEKNPYRLLRIGSSECNETKGGFDLIRWLALREKENENVILLLFKRYATSYGRSNLPLFSRIMLPTVFASTFSSEKIL